MRVRLFRKSCKTLRSAGAEVATGELAYDCGALLRRHAQSHVFLLQEIVEQPQFFRLIFCRQLRIGSDNAAAGVREGKAVFFPVQPGFYFVEQEQKCPQRLRRPLFTGRGFPLFADKIERCGRFGEEQERREPFAPVGAAQCNRQTAEQLEARNVSDSPRL